MALLAGALLGALPASALDPRRAITQYVHEVWRTEQGLPVNEIQALAQAADGYLWVGTEDGLLRFDGLHFQLFDRRNSALVNHSVLSLLGDREGSLWIGTARGLARLQQGAFTHYGAREGFSDDGIRCLLEGQSRSLWIGTLSSGLFRLRDGRFTAYTTRDGLADNSVGALLEDRTGALWIGSRAGLQRFKDGVFTTYTTRDGLLHDSVTVLYEDRGGSLWVGTFAGLNRMKDGTLVAVAGGDGVAGSRVNGVVEDGSGAVWVGTHGGGVTRLEGGRVARFTAREGLSNDFVTELSLDRDGSLWIGTSHGGLNRLKDGLLTAFGTREGLSHDVAVVVYEDASRAIWIGTHGGGLNRFEGGAFTAYRTKDGLLSDQVFALQGARRGGLWVGTRNGLNLLRNGRFAAVTSPELPSDRLITTIHEDPRGTLWLGTYGGGLKRVHDGGFTSFTTKDGLSNDFVWTLLAGRDGGLWVGTRQGLNLFRDGAFRRYSTRDGLPSDTVLSLFEDRDGSLWIGTEAGLSRFRDGRFANVTTREGLFHDTVYSIVEDDADNLWMSCNKGIFRVGKSQLTELAEGRRRSIVSVAYGVGDGMKNAGCVGPTHPAAWRTHDGRLLFPTEGGMVVVDPAHLGRLPAPPAPTIDEVLVDGRAAPGPGFVAGPDSFRFEFRYSAPYLSDPRRVRFRYRLDDVDRDWVEAGAARVAHYSNLPPGPLRFRVVAGNEEGLWNGTEASYELRRRPYFRQTTTFYALCTLGALLLVWAVHRYRVRRLLEVERVRMRIAGDLHDDIGASLSQIAIFSEVARSKVAAGQPGEALATLERMGHLSRESVDAMGDIVWALDPRKDRLLHLTQRLRGLAAEVLTPAGINFSFEADDAGRDLALGTDVRREVFLVFKESLHNVVRHSGARRADLAVRRQDGSLVLRVSDDGRGFDLAASANRTGLESMRRRAAAIGGRLHVSSAPGQGTTVTLTAPLSRRSRGRGAASA